MWDELWKAIVLYFIIAMGVAVAFGMVLMWGLPKVWEWIKPFIHAATA